MSNKGVALGSLNSRYLNVFTGAFLVYIYFIARFNILKKSLECLMTLGVTSLKQRACVRAHLQVKVDDVNLRFSLCLFDLTLGGAFSHYICSAQVPFSSQSHFCPEKDSLPHAAMRK